MVVFVVVFLDFIHPCEEFVLQALRVILILVICTGYAAALSWPVRFS